MRTGTRWPDFFIVGAPKAGTTTLYEHLVSNPGVCIPVKEPHFFDRGIDRSVFFTQPIEREDDYAALYAACPPDACAGDGTPTYLVDPSSAGAIASVAPDAKIIAVIRDPVDRAVSHFRFREARVGRSDRSLAEAIAASQSAAPSDYADSYLVHAGHYATGIGRYLSAFGPAHVHVVFFEDLLDDPTAAMREVCDFLDVEFTGLAPVGWRKQNAAAQPRGRWASAVLRSRAVRFVARRMPNAMAQWLGRRVLMEAAGPVSVADETRAVLEHEYEHEADEIERLLGRRPPWPWVGPGQSAN